MARYPEPYQQNGTGPFWIAFQIDGKRRKIGLRTTDRAEAKRLTRTLYDQAQIEHATERQAEGRALGKPIDMPLDMAIGKFWTGHVLGENLKGQNEIWRRLSVINTAIGPETMLSRIDDGTLRAFRQKRSSTVSERTNRVLSPNTVQGELAEVQRLMVFAEKALKVPVQVIDWKRIKFADAKLPKRTRTLSPSESVLILDSIGTHYRALLEFANATGMRLASFTGLTWDQVQWHNRVILYKQKGDKYHTIHITAEIETILRSVEPHRTEGGPVFTFVRGKQRRPITYWGFCSQWRRTIARLGIQHATPHDVRRTYVSAFVDSTNDLVAASKAAGHSSTKVTETVYLQLPTQHVRDAAEKASLSRLAARTSVLKVS